MKIISFKQPQPGPRDGLRPIHTISIFAKPSDARMGKRMLSEFS